MLQQAEHMVTADILAQYQKHLLRALWMSSVTYQWFCTKLMGPEILFHCCYTPWRKSFVHIHNLKSFIFCTKIKKATLLCETFHTDKSVQLCSSYGCPVGSCSMQWLNVLMCQRHTTTFRVTECNNVHQWPTSIFQMSYDCLTWQWLKP